jgi:ADP-ribose pyrophosphatase YjhB (NUDIX family)
VDEFFNEVKKRKTVGFVICIAENDEFLIIKRSAEEGTKEGYWDLPGGHIDDEDKSIEKGILRELKEETNLEAYENDLQYIQKINSEDANKYFYAIKTWSGEIKFKPNPKTGVIEHTEAKWKTIEEIKDDKSLELRTFPIYLLDKALKKFKND